jgi:hypothetical protein
MLMLVFPAVVSSYEARYVVPTVPFFCVAAALAIREIGLQAPLLVARQA